MIIPRAFSSAKACTDPFVHIWFDEGQFVSENDAALLLDSFPSTSLKSQERMHGSDKSYALLALTIFDERRPGGPGDAAWLPPPWQRLLKATSEEAYRTSLAKMLGVRAPKIRLELRLTEYGAGNWMSRHTDRADKMFSQIVYLCREWRREDGGGLAIYDHEHARVPVRIIKPGLGNSVAFARSDQSWHEVEPISGDAPHPRRALLIHGYH